MSATLSKYERWIREVLKERCPDIVEPVYQTISAYDRIVESPSHELPADDLAVIKESASSHRRPLYEFATNLMADLAATKPEAQIAVLDMIRNRKWQVRFNAILCLCKATPRDLIHQVLSTGLKDASCRVRAKAADWALTLRFRDAIPNLSVALENESDDGTRRTIEFSLRLLRDGYILEPAHDEGFYLTLPYKGGISSEYIADAELRERDPETLIAERKVRLDNRAY
jgi:hypothetical protein